MKNQPVASSKPMKLTALLQCAACVAGSLFATVAVAQQTQYSHGDPTVLEQQMLELINRARLNPPQEGIILNAVNTWYSVAARAQAPSFFTNLVAEFATYPAVEPLAFNPLLIQAARAHSQDMITNNYFSHISPSGQDPTARAAALGYSGGVGENIDGAGASVEDDILEAHFDFMVDYNNIDPSSPLGHRLNILSSSYSEIGVGVVGPRVGGMISQEFGTQARAYILGVAYSDANANGSFDAGEGLAGITVRPDSGNWFAITSNSGGFAIPVDPVQTVSDTLNVPFPVQTTPWATVQPYDTAYRQQQIAAAPNMTVNLTWSGGALAAPKTTSVTMKQPVQRNYRIVGTDGWYYTMSMVTTQNVKADLVSATTSISGGSTSLRDFNGDGKTDIVWQSTSTGLRVIWFMNGTTVIGQANLGVVPTDWQIAGIGDFNGDGKPDILWQNTINGARAIWFMNGATYAGSANLGVVPTDWQIAGTGDFNGDGQTDIVWQNTANGARVIWFMSGSIYTGSANLGTVPADWKIRN